MQDNDGRRRRLPDRAPRALGRCLAGAATTGSRTVSCVHAPDGTITVG